MCNKSIAIVILHYNDFDMTKNYIESLRTLNWENITHKFIIVDNASPDGSGFKLHHEYYWSEDVEVLLVEKNLGFAKGNNVGILYARKELNSELVVVSNNDIEIKTKLFPEKIMEIYGTSGFAVYGPDIYSVSRKIHQNPFRETPLNQMEVREKIKKIDRTLPILRILDELKLYSFLRKLKSFLPKGKQSIVGDYSQKKEDCVLHGSFFVLSEKYFEKYSDGLYGGTFLYMEEDILAYRCRVSKLKMLYDPKISVIHFDGVSSLKESGDRCKKYIRELTETRKSCISYINHMRKLGDE